MEPIALGNHPPDDPSLMHWLETMQPWLHARDELAERVVGELRGRRGSMGSPAQSLQRLADEGHPASQALLTEMSSVPDWVDFDVMRLGGAMAQRHFPMLILALTYGCMPLTFANPDAAVVFARTGRMEANISRRLNESGTLFFGVCNSDDLAPGRSMWAACVQVRLIHAMVRMHLLDKGWDVARRGIPISQLATAAGPAFFGTHLLTCLRRLGAQFSDDEARGHCMIWRHVTYLLGVPQALIGKTQTQQDEFDRYISSSFFAPDETARSVMAALIEGLCTLPPTARVPRSFQLALFRRMLGDAAADAYGIPKSLMGERLLNAALPLLSGYGRLTTWPVLAGPLRRSGQRILQRLSTEGLVKLDVAGTPDDHGAKPSP